LFYFIIHITKQIFHLQQFLLPIQSNPIDFIDLTKQQNNHNRSIHFTTTTYSFTHITNNPTPHNSIFSKRLLFDENPGLLFSKLLFNFQSLVIIINLPQLGFIFFCSVFCGFLVNMDIDEAIRGCEDRRLQTKYNNATYVIQRALSLYS
jgi:hypothetical protein